MGTQVKKTVMSRKNFRPQTSERAPMSGALRNDRMPLIPITNPFIKNVWSGKVLLRTLMRGICKKYKIIKLTLNKIIAYPYREEAP